MPRGAKPGERRGGRQVGAPTIKTQRIAKKVAEDGEVTPLEVMIENMRFWHGQASNVTEAIMDLLPALKAGDMSGEERAELVAAMKNLVTFREKAQACATDAAPYIHPRLANIQMKVQNDDVFTLIDQKTMDAKTAYEAYANTLKGVAPQKQTA